MRLMMRPSKLVRSSVFVRPWVFVRPSAAARGRGESCARATVAASSRGGSNNASERTLPNNNAPFADFRSKRATTSPQPLSALLPSWVRRSSLFIYEPRPDDASHRITLFAPDPLRAAGRGGSGENTRGQRGDLGLRRAGKRASRGHG